MKGLAEKSAIAKAKLDGMKMRIRWRTVSVRGMGEELRISNTELRMKNEEEGIEFQIFIQL